MPIASPRRRRRPTTPPPAQHVLDDPVHQPSSPPTRRPGHSGPSVTSNERRGLTKRRVTWTHSLGLQTSGPPLLLPLPLPPHSRVGPPSDRSRDSIPIPSRPCRLRPCTALRRLLSSAAEAPARDERGGRWTARTSTRALVASRTCWARGGESENCRGRRSGAVGCGRAGLDWLEGKVRGEACDGRACRG